jgi:hypothetical protein
MTSLRERLMRAAFALIAVASTCCQALATQPGTAGDPMLLTDGATALADTSASGPVRNSPGVVADVTPVSRHDGGSDKNAAVRDPMLLTDGTTRSEGENGASGEFHSGTARASDILSGQSGLGTESDPDNPAAWESEDPRVYSEDGNSGRGESICGSITNFVRGIYCCGPNPCVGKPTLTVPFNYCPACPPCPWLCISYPPKVTVCCGTGVISFCGTICDRSNNQNIFFTPVTITIYDGCCNVLATQKGDGVVKGCPTRTIFGNLVAGCNTGKLTLCPACYKGPITITVCAMSTCGRPSVRTCIPAVVK